MQYLNPIGGTSDDWPTLKAAMDLYAYDEEITLNPGTWLCKTKQSIPSGTVLIGSPGVRIISSLTYGAVDPFNAVFSAGPTFAGTPASSTLAADATVGSNQVSVNASFSAGTIVRIALETPGAAEHGLCQQYYTVKAVSGSGPYTLTLDRPVRRPYLATNPILEALTVPTDIRILGNGMQVSGTADRYVEIAAGKRCLVSGLYSDNGDGALGALSPAMSFDIGGVECRFEDCIVESYGNSTNAGCILESCERSTISNCQARYAGITGFGLYDCDACAVINSHAYGCIYGGFMGSDGVQVGCSECKIQGGTFWNNQQGILIGFNERSKISDVDCSYNTQNGIKIASGEADACITNISAIGNVHYGVYLMSDVLPVQGSAWRCEGNRLADVQYSSPDTVANVLGSPPIPYRI